MARERNSDSVQYRAHSAIGANGSVGRTRQLIAAEGDNCDISARGRTPVARGFHVDTGVHAAWVDDMCKEDAFLQVDPLTPVVSAFMRRPSRVQHASSWIGNVA